MMAHISDVARFDKQIGEEYFLNIEVVLVRHWRRPMPFVILDRRDCSFAGLDGAEPRRIQGWPSVGWKTVLHQQHVRRIRRRRYIAGIVGETKARRRVDRVADIRTVEDAAAAADHQVLHTRYAVGEAKSRTEISIVRIKGSPRLAIAS